MATKLAFDYLGYTYDTSVPAFVITGPNRVVHRITTRFYAQDKLEAQMAESGYTPLEGEIGESPEWLNAHGGEFDSGGGGGDGGETPEAGTGFTGATAGTPGSFSGGTPEGSAPADLATLQGDGDLGNTTAWAEGEYVVLADGSEAYWDGTAWAEGKAPAVEPPALVYEDATVTVAGEGSATATITVGGAGQDGANAGVIYVGTFKINDTPINGMQQVTINEGDDVEVIAAALGTMLDGLQDAGQALTVSADTTASVVTVTEAGGGTITALVATVYADAKDIPAAE